MNTYQVTNIVTHNMLKTRYITGFDAFTKIAEYDEHDASVKASNGKNDVLGVSHLASLVFGTQSRNTRRIRRTDGDEVVQFNTVQSASPHQIVQKDIRETQIQNEKQLFVPNTFTENRKVPWELVVMSLVDDQSNIPTTNSSSIGSKPIDNFLDLIDFSGLENDKSLDESKDCSSDEVSQDIDSNTQHDSSDHVTMLTQDKNKCKEKFLHRTDKLMPSRLQFHNTMEYEKLSAPYPECLSMRRDIIHTPDEILNQEYKIRNNITIKISNTIYLMIINTVLEKLMKRINHEVKKMDGIDPKSFWITDESNMFASSDVSFFSRIPNTQANVHGKEKNANREIHKKQMLEYVQHAICENNICTVSQMKELFASRKNIPKLLDFDEYGITTALKNHPFIFYCVVDGRCQMYKLVITDINYPTKINYKLYQIDKLPSNNSNDEFVVRPLIISRDITDKFTTVKTQNTSDSQNSDSKKLSKFVLQKNFVKLEVNDQELRDKDVILLHRLNDYATYWASFIYNIMNDATRCIRAYVRNPKKTKIQFDPMISPKIIRSILSEIHRPDLLAEDAKEKVQNRLVAINSLRELQIITDNFLEDRGKESLMFRMFHPFSHLIREVSKKQIVDKEKFNKLTEEISQQTTLSTDLHDLHDRLISNVVLMRKSKYHTYLRDMLFMNNDENIYHFVTDLTTSINKIFDNTKNIICNLSFSSNCIMKMYIRVNDTCVLIGEGNNIKFPMIYEHIVHNMFIKIEADPDKIIDMLKKTNIPPYIQVFGTWMKTNMSDESSIFDVGSIIDCISNCGTSKETLSTYLKVNLEVDDKKYLYFGQIKNHEHMQEIESMIKLNKYVYLTGSGSSELNEL